MARRLLDEPLQDIGNNNKQIQGDRVALTEDTTTRNPVPGNTIQHDSSARSGQDSVNPSAPMIIKALQRRIVSKLLHSTESKAFLKSNLRTSVGARQVWQQRSKVSRLDEILGNTAAMDKTSLVSIDGVQDGRTKAVRHR